jgi:hypothetical protein
MKIEFIKETKMDGYNTYYTKVGGYYVNNSLSLKENEARELFERIKKDGPNALENKIEVVETFEYKANEEK